MSVRRHIIVLSDDDLLCADVTAAAIIEFATKNNIKGRHGAPDGSEGEMYNYTGSRSELALAKAMDLPWTGNVGIIDAPDVVWVDARGMSKPGCYLRVHKTDKNDRPYVMIDASRCPVISIGGWLWGLEAKWKVPEPWDPFGTGRPALWVKEPFLREFDELLEINRRFKND